MTNSSYTCDYSWLISNKYSKWYIAIISRAKSRKKLTGYTEKHHIIPRCLGGNNRQHNIAILTSREHFICHILLAKCTSGDTRTKMVKAAMCMRRSPTNQKRYVNSRLYSEIKRQYSKIQSEKVTGKNNPGYGLSWVTNYKTKHCLRIKLTELPYYIEDGYVRGRCINFADYDENGKRIIYRRRKSSPDIVKISGIEVPNVDWIKRYEIIECLHHLDSGSENIESLYEKMASGKSRFDKKRFDRLFSSLSLDTQFPPYSLYPNSLARAILGEKESYTYGEILEVKNRIIYHLTVDGLLCSDINKKYGFCTKGRYIIYFFMRDIFGIDVKKLLHLRHDG